MARQVKQQTKKKPTEYLSDEARSVVLNAMRRSLGKDGGPKDVRKVARDSLLSLLWERTKQRPLVIVNIIEV